MSGRTSAGLLMYRLKDGELEVFLAHPGGPFYSRKDDGVWSIPKGEVGDGEDRQAAAVREFTEETGITPAGELISLGTVAQKSGKVVHAWAFLGDRDGAVPISSNLFEMEWPPGSGRTQQFPEIDRADFFLPPAARRKIHPAQAVFIQRLEEHLMREP